MNSSYVIRCAIRAAIGVLVSGCVGMGQYEIQSDRYVRYYCDGGRKFRVWFQQDRATAVVDLGDRSVSLPKVTASESGDYYSDGVTGLSVKDDIAVVEENGAVTYSDCLSG
ncbi:MAG: MliC family protein [Pseudomonadota bacterium]